MQAGDAPGLQDASPPGGGDQDTNAVPLSSPSLSRSWWSSASPLKRSRSVLKSAASSASCISGGNADDPLDLRVLNLNANEQDIKVPPIQVPALSQAALCVAVC